MPKDNRELRYVLVAFRTPKEAWRFQSILKQKGFQNEFEGSAKPAIALLLHLQEKRIVPVMPSAMKMMGLDGRINPLYGSEVLSNYKQLVEQRDRRTYLSLLAEAKANPYRTRGVTLLARNAVGNSSAN